MAMIAWLRSVWGRLAFFRFIFRSLVFVIIVQGVGFVLFLWWIPTKHLPLPGFAVGIIAFLGAVMSVQPSPMRPRQKFIWLILIGAFMVTELRAIRKDRNDSNVQALKDRNEQDQKFQGIRDAENKQFQTTAGRLTEAINGIQSTLDAANATLIQTKPHAFVRFAGIDLAGEQPTRIEPNHDYGMNVHFIDDGDASARDVQMLFKVYITKADDLEAQQNIVKDFEAAWTKGEAKNIGDVITAHEPRFLTMNRTFKPEEFNVPRGTIYWVLRFEYTDDVGRWRSDACKSVQWSPKQLDSNISHPCFIFERSRYAVKKQRQAAGRR
jgi:hypothetical protein